MPVDNLKEFGIMLAVGAVLAVMCYAYEKTVAPSVARMLGIPVSGCGCGGAA